MVTDKFDIAFVWKRKRETTDTSVIYSLRCADRSVDSLQASKVK